MRLTTAALVAGGGGLQDARPNPPGMVWYVRRWCEIAGQMWLALPLPPTLTVLFVLQDRRRSSSNNVQYLAPPGAILCRVGRCLSVSPRCRYSTTGGKLCEWCVDEMKSSFGGGDEEEGLLGRDEEKKAVVCVRCVFVRVTCLSVRCVYFHFVFL